MLGLSDATSSSRSPHNYTQYVKKISKKASKAIMRSYKFKLSKNYDLPIRLRPWFLIFTFVIMLLLAFLGFTNTSRSIPLNDKLLHLVCLGLATGVFYFIFDVEEEARRIWVWRHAGLIMTGVICFFFGGVVSEIVQSLLPYKDFQMGDVIANLIGSGFGLWVSYNLERYYRHRREISRLYHPVVSDPDALQDSDEDDDAGTMLLPLHNVFVPKLSNPKSGNGKGNASRLANVWDEREDLFGIGDSDEEDEASSKPGKGKQPTPASAGPAPKIIITES